jgi:signal peptidase I
MPDMLEPVQPVTPEIIAPNPEIAGLMKKAFRKIMVFVLSMTIAVLIVILKQGEDLFLFNFSASNMNDDSSFWIFRLLTTTFLFFTFCYFVYFTVFYQRRTKKSEEERVATLADFKKRFDIFDLLSVVPTFMAVFILITGFFVSPAIVEGSSMEPAYTNGEPVLIYYFLENYRAEDVVIVDITTELLIKRLIGLPGDHLKIDLTGVYLNGVLIEDTLPVHTVPGEGNVPWFIYDGIIPEGSYFVMGDNRGNSTDGRRFGLVDRDQLLGIVILPAR